MIYEFNGYKPVIHPSSFVHKEATVIGNVIIGENVYIGPGASLRGDWGQLNVGNGCNVQDNCILHIFPGKDVILEENAHIGHGAIVHGAHIKGEMIIPDRKIVVGNPAIIKGDVTDEMIKWKIKGTELYQELPHECRNLMKECKPLSEIEKNRKEKQKIIFETWKKSK